MNAAWWLNSAWMLSARPELRRFEAACRNVAETQQHVLNEVLRPNAATWFGEKHRFDEIRTPQGFRSLVPLADPNDTAESVARIAAGEPNVMTAEPVRLLEPTSGTTRAEKLIPYTSGLRAQFQRGISAWIADLFLKRPALRAGRAYWSISPSLGPARVSAGGIPIGFESDAAYLGTFAKFAVERLLAVPANVASSPTIEAFRYTTLRYLLAADDLTLISIWNPTFALALLAPLDDWRERLCDDIERGDPMRNVRPAPRRAYDLREVFRSSASTPDRLRAIWPRLQSISCWTDAAAGFFVPELRRRFPGVEIQPKGLLATEAFVSLPLVGEEGGALSVRSHFFEFEETSTGTFRLGHELERGGTYRVIVTTAGGLYRYPLRDEVEVVGHRGQCPRLRFLGKADLASDLVGEKLAEIHVRGVLDRVLRESNPNFRLLTPVLGSPPRYRLYLQFASVSIKSEVLMRIADDVSEELRQNPYYRHAADMGQLGSLELAVLDPQGEPGWSIVERKLLQAGQKAGDVKPRALDPATDWSERFPPPIVTIGAKRSDTPTPQGEIR